MVWLAAIPAQPKKTSRGIGLSFILARTHLINREWARCQRFHAAARREEGEYPSWIFDRRATRPQRQRIGKRCACPTDQELRANRVLPLFVFSSAGAATCHNDTCIQPGNLIERR